MAPECELQLGGLALLFLAFLVSMSLNVFLSIRLRAALCRDKDDCLCCPHILEREGPSQEEARYFQDHNHHMQQENPIYGNISSDRTETNSTQMSNELMNMQQTRNHFKPLETDLNYASLDFKKQKRKYQQQRHKTPNSHQDQLLVHRTTSMNSFLEVDRDVAVNLPPRDTSIMVSHGSSVYLNSQQIARETEEMGRERRMSMEREDVGWAGMEQQEDGGMTAREREDAVNGTVCVQAPQSDSDPFSSSYGPDIIQQL